LVAVLEAAAAGTHPHCVRGAAEALGSLGQSEPPLALADAPLLHKPIQLVADDLDNQRAQRFPYPVLEIRGIAQGAVCSSEG
jgi:hypothetical protein